MSEIRGPAWLTWYYRIKDSLNSCLDVTLWTYHNLSTMKRKMMLLHYSDDTIWSIHNILFLYFPHFLRKSTNIKVLGQSRFKIVSFIEILIALSLAGTKNSFSFPIHPYNLFKIGKKGKIKQEIMKNKRKIKSWSFKPSFSVFVLHFFYQFCWWWEIKIKWKKENC